jgi:hypothetical protein
MFAETKSNASKVPSLELAKGYCKLIEMMGYTPIQLGLSSDPQLCEQRFVGTFFDTVKVALGCKMVVTVDSALAWIMSGYSHPTIGLYSSGYYAGATSATNWQPINPNAIYLEAPLISYLLPEVLEVAIRKI